MRVDEYGTHQPTWWGALRQRVGVYGARVKLVGRIAPCACPWGASRHVSVGRIAPMSRARRDAVYDQQLVPTSLSSHHTLSSKIRLDLEFEYHVKKGMREAEGEQTYVQPAKSKKSVRIRIRFNLVTAHSCVS